MFKFLSKIIKDPDQVYLKKLQPIVEKINALEKEYEKYLSYTFFFLSFFKKKI